MPEIRTTPDDDADRRVLRVSRGLSVPLSELEWRFSRSSGPGGQHANTASTKAEVRFDVASSASLGPRQRARLIERLGREVRVVAEDERSQAQPGTSPSTPCRQVGRGAQGRSQACPDRSDQIVGAPAGRDEAKARRPEAQLAGAV